MDAAIKTTNLELKSPSFESFTYKLSRRLICEKCGDCSLSEEVGTHFMLHFTEAHLKT